MRGVRQRGEAEEEEKGYGRWCGIERGLDRGGGVGQRRGGAEHT